MKETGLREDVLKLMTKNKKTLYSINDLLEIFKRHNQLKPKDKGQKYKAFENIFRNLRIEGKISRHVDKDENNDIQYAVLIHKDKIEKWVLVQSKQRINTGTKTTYKKRKQLLTSKEIRSMFATHYNNMAKLEDSCMAIIEHSESTEKEMEKIRNFLKK